jgi:hypothetical protein
VEAELAEEAHDVGVARAAVIRDEEARLVGDTFEPAKLEPEPFMSERVGATCELEKARLVEASVHVGERVGGWGHQR